MHACRSLLAAVAVPVWLAACASTPSKPQGIFDLSNGLDRSSSAGNDTPTRPQPDALSPPAPGSIGNSIGAPTSGHVEGGFGN